MQMIGAYLQVGLALLLDLFDGKLGASIAHYLRVGRIQLISEQGPDKNIEQKKKKLMKSKCERLKNVSLAGAMAG